MEGCLCVQNPNAIRPIIGCGFRSMTMQVTVLRVFVASPGDVSEERAVLEEVVQNINLVLGDSVGIRFELIKWETHSYPGFGEDAQDVINKQVSDDYDIFIGIMWTRFGTATGRAQSGTQEEFERAYNRFKADPNIMDILLYFKTAGKDLDQIDVDQLALVKKYMEKAAKLGGYYFRFKDADEFQRLAHLHLQRIAQNWTRKQAKHTQIEEHGTTEQRRRQKSNEIEESTVIDDSEEYGLLDHAVIFEDKFSVVEVYMTKIAESTDMLGVKINARVAQMEDIRSRESSDLKNLKRVTNLTAGDMITYSEEIEPQVRIFKTNFEQGVDAMLSYLGMMAEEENFDRRDVENNLSSVRELMGSMSEAGEAMSEMSKIVKSLPRLTKEFNSSKRRVSSILDILATEFDRGERIVKQVEESLNSLIEGK